MFSKEELLKVQQEMFDFDPEVDSEMNSSTDPKLADYAPPGWGKADKDGRLDDIQDPHIMSEEAWRRNIEARLTSYDKRIEVLIYKIRELENDEERPVLKKYREGATV